MCVILYDINMTLLEWILMNHKQVTANIVIYSISMSLIGYDFYLILYHDWTSDFSPDLFIFPMRRS